MNKFSRKFFVLLMVLSLCFSTNMVAVAAEDNTVDVEQNEMERAGWVLIDCFNLSAAPGNSASNRFTLSGYSSYRFVVTYVGVTGAVINLTQTTANNVVYAINNGTTITANTTHTTQSFGVSGTYTFQLFTWNTSPYGAVVNVAAYGK